MPLSARIALVTSLMLMSTSRAPASTRLGSRSTSRALPIVLNDAAPSKLARAVRRRQSCTGSPRLTSSACCCGRTMPCSSNRSHSSAAGLPSRPPIRVLSRSRLCTLRWCSLRTTYVATKSELAAVYESIHPFVNFSAANGTYALDGRGALCSTAER